MGARSETCSTGSAELSSRLNATNRTRWKAQFQLCSATGQGDGKPNSSLKRSEVRVEYIACRPTAARNVLDTSGLQPEHFTRLAQ